jgi:coproporphyrinogen III oxidase
MDISDSVEYKKYPHTMYGLGMAGYGFYSNRRGTRGIGGVFFKMGGV